MPRRSLPSGAPPNARRVRLFALVVLASLGCGSEILEGRRVDGGAGDASLADGAASDGPGVVDAFIETDGSMATDGSVPPDACPPLTCAAGGASCGPLPDGCGATLDCGGCAGSASCVAGTCVACTPRSCAAAGASCGSVSDGCGGSLACGGCGGPERCVANSCRVPDRFEGVMTVATVNIGRNYGSRAAMANAVGGVRDVLGPKSGPAFIGWQEIGEGDPCGGCEIDVIRTRFPEAMEWRTKHPRGTRPDGGRELVKVPITSRRSHDGTLGVRAAFASPGWAGVSPTRFVTVVYHPQRNVSVINTHLIAGAWSCRSNVERRKQYWRQGWQTLQNQVAREHAAGRNVFVTGDLNRPPGSNGCNPSWVPTSLHPNARIIGGEGIDYIFAVPARSWDFRYDRNSAGDIRRGSIALGIDGHRGHWVRGRFVYR